MSEHVSSSDADKEWEFLGTSNQNEHELGVRAAASKLVESFWQARSEPTEVIERSEEALSPTASVMKSASASATPLGEKSNKDSPLSTAASDTSEPLDEGEYRLFEPLRNKSKEIMEAVFRASQPSLATLPSLPSVPNQKAVLSLGLLNAFLSVVLLKAWYKNQKLSTELEKRSAIIYKLVNKVYEMKIMYNTTPITMQPNLLEITW